MITLFVGVAIGAALRDPLVRVLKKGIKYVNDSVRD
jgi:hypothetical protein